jgi:hypothetical protein
MLLVASIFFTGSASAEELEQAHHVNTIKINKALHDSKWRPKLELNSGVVSQINYNRGSCVITFKKGKVVLPTGVLNVEAIKYHKVSYLRHAITYFFRNESEILESIECKSSTDYTNVSAKDVIEAFGELATISLDKLTARGTL